MVPRIRIITLFVAITTLFCTCRAFQQVGRLLHSVRIGMHAAKPLRASGDASSISCAEPKTLNPDIASQFTIQVCTSTSCTKKLNDAGLDQYHVLGEIYALAQAAKVEKCMTIEDGGCQGGRNCKMGVCRVSCVHKLLICLAIHCISQQTLSFRHRALCCYIA